MTDDVLKEARDAFDGLVDAWGQQRSDTADDLRFARLDEQWPADVRQQRELDGRPCLTINKIWPAIRQVVNDARQNRPGIQVHPADSGADVATAKIMSGLIRNIEVSSDAEVAYDTALENAICGGFGFWRVNLAYATEDSFDQDIRIDRIADPLSVYWDAGSFATDSSDWRVAFVVERLRRDDFERLYPDADPVEFEDTGSMTASVLRWADQETVQVAEWWTREEVPGKLLALSNGAFVDETTWRAEAALFQALGVSVVAERPVTRHRVRQRLVSGKEVLSDQDWPGRYIPIVPVWGEDVVIEGRRYLRSMTRAAMDAQRMFNYWRTAATELVALAPKAPFIGPVGAFETDAEKWATANTNSWSHIEYDGPIAPQRQPFSGPPAGALQEAALAADDIRALTGLHEASYGAPSNETSGRAILARQREGDVSTFHFIDNLSRAIRHTGRILLDLIPHIYGVDRVIRILGEDEKPQTVRVGPQQPGQPPEGVERIYDLTAGRYDLIVRAGPSYTTRREEAADQMLNLIQAFPPAAGAIGPLLIRNLDWPGAEEVSARLEALSQPQGPQGPDPAKAQEAQAQAQAKQAELAIKAQEAQTKQFAAETDRLKVQLDAQRAAPVAWG